MLIDFGKLVSFIYHSIWRINAHHLLDVKAIWNPKQSAFHLCAGVTGTAEEIAEVILYLLSPASGWIKGQDITIDGGMSAMGMTDMMEL